MLSSNNEDFYLQLKIEILDFISAAYKNYTLNLKTKSFSKLNKNPDKSDFV